MEVLSNMDKANPHALARHFATVKMELINDWGVKPELADVAIQVISAKKDQVEIVIPSRVPRGRLTEGQMDSQIKEAIRYLQSRGHIDEARDLEVSMKKEGVQFKLSDIATKLGEKTVVNPLELGIAIHFLETIHPEGAEFIKEMASNHKFDAKQLKTIQREFQLTA